MRDDLDAPETIARHAELIRAKPFLRKIYCEHYSFFRSQLENVCAPPWLELGSGGGFVREHIPQMICSDVVPASTVQVACSALELPFATQTLGAICMSNVLHHMAEPSAFFSEARRCLRSGGKLLMIEPANTLFSRFIYQNFHHEPFKPEQQEWELPPGGRMSSANDALPWIIFIRDRSRFEQEFPELRITLLETYMPFRYLLSGGLTLPSLLPGVLHDSVALAERLLTPAMPWIGMFMRIGLTRA